MLITRMTKVVVVVSAPTFSDVQLSLHHKIRAPSGHSVFPQKWSEQRVRNSSQSYYGSNGSIVPWCGLYVPGILIIVICLFDRFFFCREWFLNGNILIIIVSIFIILPLAIMKQLGMFSILSSHFFFLHTVCFVAFCQVHFHVLFFFLIFCFYYSLSLILLLIPSSFLPLSSRLPGLHKWLLPVLHGVLSHIGESDGARKQTNHCKL